MLTLCPFYAVVNNTNEHQQSTLYAEIFTIIPGQQYDSGR